MDDVWERVVEGSYDVSHTEDHQGALSSVPYSLCCERLNRAA